MRADMEDRAETRCVLANPEVMADRTGPVDDRDLPADLTEV